MIKKRPIVNIENEFDLHLGNELFQNQTLRPILKLQHELLIKVFNSKIESLNINWKGINRAQKIEVVKSQLIKNIPFKNLVIGIIVGQLNETELEKYLIKKREFNKRIIQMALERIISTIS